MREKSKDKYRIESTRMQNWDYGCNGKYFITICTGGRECYFGNIKDRKIKLSEIGILADKFWTEIPNHFQFVKLVQFIIMPNHIHGIIIIDKPYDIKNGCNVETLHATSLHATSLQGNYIDIDKIKNEKMAKISPKRGSLATIIRSYKSVVTKNARNIHPEFYWQSRFYDRVIRDPISLDNIRKYIKDNPKNWTTDELNPENEKPNKKLTGYNSLPLK